MSQKRVKMLDILRGGAMLLVIAYHLLYDLAFVKQVKLPLWLTPEEPFVEAVHTGFLWVLFAVSGICSGYSRNLLRRGVWLSVLGFAVTVVTVLWIPDFTIVFGVLSGFGACMIVTALCEKALNVIPWPLLTLLSGILWLIFSDFTEGVLHLGIRDVPLTLPNVGYLYPLGIVQDSFYTVDYFPILPWLFMFWVGRGLYRPIAEGNFPKWFYAAHCAPLEWVGRHSLLIYALHQPLLLAALMFL
ncbi:MAG: DUF1624 domain-containing protein [Clostridia bacterium]|nr:DUF1624 domain-containing protein [Clostridia bacterium]